MGRSISAALCVLTLCALLTGVSDAKQIQIIEEDNGETVTIARGGTFVIQLPGNPTTGYAWQVAGGDRMIVRQFSKPRYKADSKLVGAGGMFTFQFKGVSKGRTDLRLVYRRPWEKKEKPARTFDLTVVVE